MPNQRAVLIVALSGFTGVAFAQGPPPPANLQVLPRSTSRREVTNVMKTYTQGLGVRCQYCHEYKGDNPDDLSTFDFASDAKSEKKTSRAMMRMAAVINKDLLKGVGEAPAAEQTKVTC